MANVELSNEEWQVVSNAEFLLTKNAVSEKLWIAFSSLAKDYQSVVRNTSSFAAEFITVPPKISKGEQYQGLPYLILDYPRQFGKTHVFAIRSFFWWGNYFSISLLLAGSYKERLFRILENPILQDWEIDLSDSPWNHHPISQQHFAIGECDLDLLAKHPFLKIFRQLPLRNWNEMEAFFHHSFQQLWLAISSQDDGKGL